MITNEEKLLNYLQAGMAQSNRVWKMPDWVPAKVRMVKTVRSDLPAQITDGKLVAGGGCEYEVTSNKWGAVSAKLEGGDLLGLKPSEFEVLEWVENPYK